MATAKYVLNIDPKLSPTDAKNAEQQLNGRFNKVAKNYGEEMKRQNSKVTDHFDTSMKGVFSKLKVGWIALAGVVASVLTSPFKEVDDRINELLNQSDDASVQAKRWGVDTGRYTSFIKMADVNGVNPDMAQSMLGRIADRLDQARTGEDPTLKKYLGEKDIIDVAHALFKTWNQMSAIERAGSMNDILGIRQAGAFAELVQTDWNASAKTIQGGRSASAIGSRVEKLAGFEQIQKEDKAKREYDMLFSASNSISARTLAERDRVERQRDSNMLHNIARYSELAGTEITQLKIQAGIDAAKGGVFQIVDMLADRFGLNGKTEQIQAFQKDLTRLTKTPESIQTVQDKLPGFMKNSLIKRPSFKLPGVK